jgi:cytochrome c551/c552
VRHELGVARQQYSNCLSMPTQEGDDWWTVPWRPHALDQRAARLAGLTCAERIALAAFRIELRGAFMKVMLISACIAVGVFTTGMAWASAELANANCGKCHEMDKKKKGPSYKSMAAKYKGNEAGAIKAITDPKGDHPEVKVKPEEVTTVVKWMLTQQ